MCSNMYFTMYNMQIIPKTSTWPWRLWFRDIFPWRSFCVLSWCPAWSNGPCSVAAFRQNCGRNLTKTWRNLNLSGLKYGYGTDMYEMDVVFKRFGSLFKTLFRQLFPADRFVQRPNVSWMSTPFDPNHQIPQAYYFRSQVGKRTPDWLCRICFLSGHCFCSNSACARKWHACGDLPYRKYQRIHNEMNKKKQLSAQSQKAKLRYCSMLITPWLEHIHCTPGRIGFWTFCECSIPMAFINTLKKMNMKLRTVVRLVLGYLLGFLRNAPKKTTDSMFAHVPRAQRPLLALLSTGWLVGTACQSWVNATWH